MFDSFYFLIDFRKSVVARYTWYLTKWAVPINEVGTM